MSGNQEQGAAGGDRPATDPDAHALLDALYAELLSRTPESNMQPRLAPVQAACDLLGDPQRAYPVIHIAGTNGKTSTARMVEAILREHNLRTGRYTSPHLHSVTERITLNGQAIPAADLVRCYQEIAPLIAIVDAKLVDAGEVPLTYFELLTVLAFAAFADAPVDVAVLEVGLGGQWDATNVADATVAVMTPISLDHTHLLGETVAQIALEKSGIFTEGSHVVLADQPDSAAEVLLRRAIESGSTVSREGLDFGVVQRRQAVGGQLVSIRGLAGDYAEVFLPLHGEHQAHNLAVAVAACEAFLGNGTQRIVPAVLHEAVGELTSPGRLELLRPNPLVMVDAAHNVAGAQALVAAVEDAFTLRHLVGVVGVLADKDAESILGVLEPILDEVVITRSTSPRAIDVDDLADVAREVFGEDRVHVEHRLDDAIVRAINLAEAEGDIETGVLIAGSVTVAAEARLLLRAPAVDAEPTSPQEEEPL
ncbi:MAG: bifunctional folylpolyglutamate synthase/dihydrofolate synthase [Actinomycetales bacterium]